jgi:hypothetical protein
VLGVAGLPHAEHGRQTDEQNNNQNAAVKPEPKKIR